MVNKSSTYSKDQALRAKLIESVLKQASKLAGKTKPAYLPSFIRQYYAHIALDELINTPPASLAHLALHHLKNAATRKPGTPTIHVFNPSISAEGWQVGHTVIEVVCDDMPFLVDSITAEINRRGYGVHLAIHPVIPLVRNKAGKISKVMTPDAEDSETEPSGESLVHLQIDELRPVEHADIVESLIAVMSDVRLAVGDWSAMRDGLSGMIDELETLSAPISLEKITEVRDFLLWLHAGNFTFLGYREYEFSGTGAKAKVKIRRDSGLGVLRDTKRITFKELRNMNEMPAQVRAFINKPDLLMVTKADVKSQVHRPVLMDSIGVKRLDNKGKVIGQRVFFGLFTAGAYNKSARDIPLLRRKLQTTFDQSGLPAASHNGKTLLNILETFPRDELFQISEHQLLETSLGILRLQDRQRVALFLRRDDFERFMSCLIYVPRDRYTTALRMKFQEVLEEAFDGTVSAHFAHLGEDLLARLHIVVQTDSVEPLSYDVQKIEQRLMDIAQSWTDRLSGALIDAHGEMDGMRLLNNYQNAFARGYEDHFNSSETLSDINNIELTYVYGSLGLNLYDLNAHDGPPIRLKIYHPKGPAALSDVLPILEDLGLRVLEEIPFRVTPKDAPYDISLHDFGLEPRAAIPGSVEDVRGRFHSVFDQVWAGNMESDSLNALVLYAGLDGREITVLRAYTKYLRQTGIAFSEDYMSQTLNDNTAVTRAIVDLFKAHVDLDPSGRAAKVTRLRTKIYKLLEDVSSADQDRILRRFTNLVDATLRTNFHQTDPDGEPKKWLSMKFSSAHVEELPLPRPKYEIFVYSAEVEGIHLRFGNVARGGLRWSDRREDFRTEILGLVKAQQVKNAVIVPVGSKGGFVMKNPPAADQGRDAFIDAGIACYKTFIRGLLDLTDNLNPKGKVLPPKNVVRHDGDDPYLVVAADKGTATFSDIANGVSAEYGFWLGDAFASGGSVGYDHKKMGITARGGWESVKRHFREMGVNTQTEDFSVVGVGDMSGDVFGNGMLLSEHICLVGAFNHMHIFVDPTPNSAATFKERKRLFNLPRSSWTDFNEKLISKGGGIFDRRAKSIPLSPQMKQLFGVSADKLTPNALIRLILTLDADLLWFGGIGTYVKSSTESNADAGDRSNDALRVDGGELRAKVLGEGANLGITQRGRIEFAQTGGRLNSDAIDNSAGVDCSDHEVNIKILLDVEVQKKKMTPRARHALLERMTDEVGLLVLQDNYQQTQAISLTESFGTGLTDHQMRLMRDLEKLDRLNRDVEFLPRDDELIERVTAGQGLTRPEISVLISYSKLWLFDEIIASDLPDDDFLKQDLSRYFPVPLQGKFAAAIGSHRLRREIVATRVSNSLINRVGGTFVSQVMEKTGMGAAEIARAFIVTREVFGVRALWQQIESLDNKISADVQTSMLIAINNLLERGTIWVLRNGDQPIHLQNLVNDYQAGITALTAGVGGALPPKYQSDLIARGKVYEDQGVPKALALQIAGLVNIAAGTDVVRLADHLHLDVCAVAQVYFAVGARFRLGRLRAACENLEGASHWQKLAVSALIEELLSHQIELTARVLASVKKGKSIDPKALEKWEGANEAGLLRTDHLLNELWSGEIPDMAMISVASRSLKLLISDGA